MSRIATEIARRGGSADPKAPLAVVLGEASELESAAAIVGAVDDAARALGVRPGMKVSEAMARSAGLAFATASPRAIEDELAALGEMALAFGTTVEVNGHDTIWVDITGVAHLFGGEAALLEEMEARLGAGHRTDVAIADGPFLAQALARFAGLPDLPKIAPDSGLSLMSGNSAKKIIARLPVAALDLGAGCVAFFARLGVFTLADLMKIERSQLVSRLGGFITEKSAGPSLQEVLGWLDGTDNRPLIPFSLPEVMAEHAVFEEGVENAGQLVFAVRGLVSRLSARLQGRRQATHRVEVRVHFDRSIFMLETGQTGVPLCSLFIDLPAPLSHTEDLFRAVKAKVESLVFVAPAVRLAIELSRIVKAPEIQLDLSRDVAVNPDALPAVLSELSAEIGSENVGVLEVMDDHRPERRSVLVGAASSEVEKKERSKPQLALFSADKLEPAEPTRLLAEPVSLGCTAEGGRRLSAFQPGATVFVGCDAFVVEKISFDRRIDSVAWWTSKATSRDYLRVTLSQQPSKVKKASTAEAWIFVDRKNGGVFLQGWWE